MTRTVALKLSSSLLGAPLCKASSPVVATHGRDPVDSHAPRCHFITCAQETTTGRVDLCVQVLTLKEMHLIQEAQNILTLEGSSLLLLYQVRAYVMSRICLSKCF